MRRSLAGLELAAIGHRRGIRHRLNMSDDELSALLYLEHNGDVPQARLQALTKLSRSGLGAMVQRLEQDGLVDRRPVPGDRRLRLLRLSRTGRQRIERAYRELDDATTRLLAELSADELHAVDRLLTGLAAAIEAVGRDDTHERAQARATDPIWRQWG